MVEAKKRIPLAQESVLDEELRYRRQNSKVSSKLNKSVDENFYMMKMIMKKIL